MATIPDEHKNLDHINLLGWYDQKGTAYLSTWEGEGQIVNVVILGLNGRDMPLWRTAVPDGCELEVIPPEITRKDFVAYATQRNGVYAFGFYCPKGVVRWKWVDDPAC